MAERKNPDLESAFNPRLLIGGVLTDLLDRRAADLKNGEFPSDELLRTMGGSQLSAAVEHQLQEADPTNFLRIRATLELWGTPGTPVPLPDSLYEAFSLQPPQLGPLQGASHRRTTTIVPPPGQRQDARIEALQAWAAGRARLDQEPAQYFRGLIYDALDGYMDWDAHNLQQSAFAQRNAGAAFAQRYIVFRNQVMNVPSNADVLLTIPSRADDADSLRATAIALEGLHRYREMNSWEFDNGFLALQKLAACLEEWSSELVRQYKQLPDRNGEWHPVRSAVELLAVGAAMAGRLAANDTPEDALNALFQIQRWPEPTELTAAPEWRNLYRELHRQREQLMKVIRSRASATKGGRAGPLVDPAQLLPPLEALRRNWQLRWDGPPDARGLYDMYQSIAELHPKVRNQLPAAARAELTRRLAWLEEVRARVAKGSGRKELVEGLSALRTMSAAQGVAAAPATQAAFDRALTDFEGVLFDDAVRQTELLQAQVEQPARALPQLGRVQPRAVEASMRLFSCSEQYMQGLENNLRAKLDDLQREAGGIDIVADQKRIAASLRVLADGLAELEQVA
jgi:hypothetical protein